MKFFLSLPFLGAGYVWAWIVDMFERGRVLYGLHNCE
jgi:hypothetical protein